MAQDEEKTPSIQYSLWLCPASPEIYYKYSTLIHKTCNKYNVLPFEPHVTLNYTIQTLDFDKIHELVNYIAPFKLEIDRLYRGKQSVRLKMKLTTDLNNAHMTAKRIFNQLNIDRIYHPHLSLIYNAPQHFDEIFDTIDLSSVHYISEFEVNAIEIWLTPLPGQQIEKWRKIKTISLDPNMRDNTPKVLKLIDHIYRYFIVIVDCMPINLEYGGKMDRIETAN